MGCMGSTSSAGGGSAGGGSKDVEAKLKENYTIGKTLGKGGSCRVVVATEKKTSSQFALKIMSKRERLNKDLFQKEIDILTDLKHPNIIRLHDSFQDESHYYVFTNLCNGGELFDRIVDKKNPITEKRAAELVKTMLDAIDYLHKKNIVHRDLKPENFVFETKAQDSKMVLIDFGCAKVVEDETPYKDLVGTPYYLAPESAAGHKYVRTGKVLKSSDVWSIGVIAYVMMTGRPPFNGRSNNEIFAAIIKKKVKFPTNVKLSESFQKFTKKMLKKSPKQRYTVADALAHPWVNGEASEEKISDDVLKVLRQFNKQSQLKKAITKTLAQHMGSEPEEKIKAHFKRLDKDNSGALDASELSLLLQDMGITEAAARQEAQEIIKGTDDDSDGLISFNEFAQVWQRKLLSVNESYIHAVFTVLDEDGDGTIDLKELAKVLDLDEAKDKEELEKIVKEVDTDNDKKISFEEFKNAMLEKDIMGKNNNVGHELKSDEVHAMNIGDVNLDNIEDED